MTSRSLSKKPRVAKKSRAGKEPPPSLVTGGQVRTLNNGLEVIVREDHEHPLVSVQIWVRAGSLHEEAWTGGGLAHCVEHMLFKGTWKRSAAEISQGIQELGGYVNAYTTFNRTVYWIDGLASHAEGYLEILADMVQHSKLDAGELEKEKDVIRREMAMDDDDPGSVMQHLLQATAFRQHPLRHPIIGHRAVFDQMTQADVAGFVRRHYVPNNCFLVIAGAVDAEACFAAAQRLLGDWERRPYAPVFLPVEPAQRGRREGRKNATTELTRLGMAWPISGEDHADKAALDVLAFLLGAGRSSRLYQELREKQGLAHWVWAGAWGAQECGLFNVEAECDPKDTDACQSAMLTVVETMQKRGPGKEELAKAVRATISGQVRSLATTKGQASMLAHGWHTAGSLDYAQHYLAAVQALTPDAIREVACRYLRPSTCSVALVGPDVETASSAKSSAKASAELQSWVLPNGLTVLLGEKPRLPLVSLRLSFLAGVPAETAANAGVTQVSAALLLKGTRRRSAAQIAAELENRGGALHCSSDAHRYVLGADVVSGDEEVALELLSDLILNARLPAAALEEVKRHQIASIQEEQEDPLTVALRRARRELFAGQAFARTALGTETSVKSLKVTDCREMLSRSFVGSNGVLSIQGNVKPARIRQWIEKTLGKLPSGDRRTLPPAKVAKSKLGVEELRLDKEQAVLVIGFRTVGLHEADSHALALIDEACSDMGSRLFNRIREELGLAYYVGAQHFAAMGAGAFYFYAGIDPQQIDLAQKEILKQIADLASNGLTEDEIRRAKTTWRSSWLRAQQGYGGLADAYGWNELNGLGHAHFQRLPEIMESLTAKDIRRVAKMYFGRVQPCVVRVLPSVK